LVGRNNEAQMYRDVEGLFRVPDSFHSDNHGTRRYALPDENYVPEDAKYWDVFGFGGNTKDFKPEERILSHQLFKTESRGIDAVSPRELVEGIVYGMIGYLNYFKKMWMHHDFSVGDVMLLRKRPPFQDLLITSTLTESTHAHRWRSCD